MVDELRKFSSAVLFESHPNSKALPSGIKPVNPEFFLGGFAYPVKLSKGDNLLLHKSIYQIPDDHILVASTDEAWEYGYWGEIMTRAALEKNIKGLVIDGCVRDGSELSTLGFPVFSRGLCIRSTSKQFKEESNINMSIKIGEVIINPGDWITGDIDGVVAVPGDNFDQVLENARNKVARENSIFESLKKGDSTIELMGL